MNSNILTVTLRKTESEKAEKKVFLNFRADAQMAKIGRIALVLCSGFDQFHRAIVGLIRDYRPVVKKIF
jgi:hypothetical protein